MNEYHNVGENCITSMWTYLAEDIPTYGYPNLSEAVVRTCTIK